MNTKTLPRRLPRIPADVAALAFQAFADRAPGDPIALPEGDALADTTVEDLQAIEADAVAAFDAIRAQDDITDEDLAEAERLRSVIVGARTEVQTRETSAADRRSRLDALADDVSDGAGDDAAGDGTDEPVDTDTTDGAGDAPADTDAETREPALVAGARPASTRGRVANVARRAPTPTPPAQRNRMSLVAAADVPHIKAGHEYTDLGEVAEAIGRRTETYPKRPIRGMARQQHGIAVMRRDFPESLVADVNGADVLAHAADQTRLPKGSLIAAGGWCAPSETLYDLAEIEGSDGLIDVPEVQATRGGIRFTQGPDFSSIYAGVGFSQTEAQAIAGTDKTCYRVPCPDFAEVRAEAIGVCITNGILQNKAYPELTRRIVRGALAAHAHKVSAKTIAKIVAGSTAVTLGTTAGAAAPILNGLELAALDTRYKHRMPQNATLEVKLPLWAKGLIRADLALRNGVDMMAVTDAQITAWMTLRSIAAQFVYDWQDSAIGGATAAVAWPTSIKFLMYPAGTWVRGHDNVITLDTVYDAAGLVKNEYVGLFTEESLLVAKTGHDSRVYTLPVKANGVTGLQVDAVPAA